MRVFPLFVNIEGRSFLVIGGGEVAKRKVGVLLAFTDRITVIAEKTDIDAPGVEVLRRRAELSDLNRADYVIAATDDRTWNNEVYEYCAEHHIPVNVVDDAEHSSFIFPAIIKKGDLTVAISTGGASPSYGQVLKKEILEELPADIEEILARMAALRETVPERVHTQERRAACYREILAALLADSAGGERTSDEGIRSIIDTYAD